MKASQGLHELGQSLRLDNITLVLLTSGSLTLHPGVAVPGLTSNPSIFYQAIKNSGDYDDATHG
jgi:transaldolase